MLSKIKEALFGAKLKSSKFSSAESAGTSRYTIRDGELTPLDEVFDAWTTRDIEKMRSALEVKTNLIDRHFFAHDFCRRDIQVKKG